MVEKENVVIWNCLIALCSSYIALIDCFEIFFLSLKDQFNLHSSFIHDFVWNNKINKLIQILSGVSAYKVTTDSAFPQRLFGFKGQYNCGLDSCPGILCVEFACSPVFRWIFFWYTSSHNAIACGLHEFVSQNCSWCVCETVFHLGHPLFHCLFHLIMLQHFWSSRGCWGCPPWSVSQQGRAEHLSSVAPSHKPP